MLNILLLYDFNSMHVGTIREHLSSFQAFSKHTIYYASATHNVDCNFDLSCFDVIVLHYSIRVSLTWHLSPKFAAALKNYKGHKVLFIQDEYDCTETARDWIENLDIQTVFTCVPEEYVEKVYPRLRFPKVNFVQNLTGYVPIEYENMKTLIRPLKDRKHVIGYRGRNLPFWYGNLGREKVEIAQKMRTVCDQNSIVTDIEWDDSKRIYGEGWYEFIASNKSTLGTESGSNVFDDYGSLKENIEAELKANPAIGYDKIFNKYLEPYEDKVKMNQISPRVFESIALKTALVLFEGTYSNIIIPDVHFIPLKKDFSNVQEVLQKVTDDVYLENMTERAYNDIILSQKYSYKSFVDQFDSLMNQYGQPMSAKPSVKWSTLEDSMKMSGLVDFQDGCSPISSEPFAEFSDASSPRLSFSQKLIYKLKKILTILKANDF